MSLDFVRIPGKTLVLLTDPISPNLIPILELLGRRDDLQIITHIALTQVPILLKQSDESIVVTSVADAKQIPELLQVLAKSGATRSTSAKWIGLCPPRQTSMQDSLIRRGMTDVIAEPVAEKSFLYKFDKIQQILRKIQKPTSTVAATPHAILETPSSGEVPTLRLLPELSLQSDFWLLKSGGVRKQGANWAVKLRGPVPQEGRWAPCEISDEPQGTWKWIMNTPDSNPTGEPYGFWTFAGQRAPEYFGDRWWFVGASPWLKFFSDGDKTVLATKFRFDTAGALCIARDSEKARVRAVQVQELWILKEAPSPGPLLELNRVSSLETPSDPWIFPRGGAELIQGRWQIRVFGPSPASGSWQVVKPNQWRWNPHNPEQDLFVGQTGVWLAFGHEPLFVKNAWVFTGERPKLAFANHQLEVIATKFMALENGQIDVTEESILAKKMVPQLKQSLLNYQRQLERAEAFTKSVDNPDGDFRDAQAAPPEMLREILRDSTDTQKPFSMLTVASMIAEWSVQPQSSPTYLATLICSFLANYWKNGSIELWRQAPAGEWTCLGSSDAKPGQWHPEENNDETTRVKRIASIGESDPQRPQWGALVIRSTSDGPRNRAALFGQFESSAEIISEFLRGVLKS